MLEALEQRRLLAGVTAALVDGELRITGTAEPESISVTKDGSKLKVVALTGTGPLYTSDQRQEWRFFAADVDGIYARLNGGDDSFKATQVEAEVTVRGGAGNDDIRVSTGNPGFDVRAYGDDGNDTVRVSIGSFNSATIYGGDGDDYLRGGLGADRIYGQYGNDTVIGGDGSDWLYGDNLLDWYPWLCGDDIVVGGFGYDHMYGGPGDDLLTKWIDLSPWGDPIYAGDSGEMYGDIGNDVLDATGANSNGMKLVGSYGNDLILGSDGPDTLDGGFGNDTLRGNAGDDTYYADDGYQDLIEHTLGGGNDTIFNDMQDILA